MDLRGADAVGAAFDALTVQYEHLLKLVEDGGLGSEVALLGGSRRPIDMGMS